MAIRMSVTIDTQPLTGYKALLKNAQRANTDIVKFTTQKNINRYMRPMEQMNPGPSLHGAKRGAWSTDPAADARARRWWWANFPNGRQRTGSLNKRWLFVLRGNRLSLENTNPAAAYVFSFAKTPRARGGRPNPGHIRTGWPQASRQAASEVLGMVIVDVRLGWSRSIAASVAAGAYRIVVP
jgi:hypothetical protein